MRVRSMRGEKVAWNVVCYLWPGIQKDDTFQILKNVTWMCLVYLY